MTSGQTMWRVVVPTALTAVLSTGSAVAVNYATGGDHSGWMWVAVAVLTVGVFAVSLWTQAAGSSTASQPMAPGVVASGARSVAVHGSPAGPIRTGDDGVSAAAPHASSPSPVPGPAPRPAPGAVAASGERAVAISGDPGAEITTGDRHVPPAQQ
ncbi:hypothetical protein [Nocardia higoensis]|uniref:hypothetical protein n=1 Tax=Nocardia higoensis TaxID=228599 RepID=UPI00031D77F3|nr:hypothetical protein [Nocardia higoensis]